MKKIRACDHALEYLESQHKTNVAHEENELNNNLGVVDNQNKAEVFYYMTDDSDEDSFVFSPSPKVGEKGLIRI